MAHAVEEDGALVVAGVRELLDIVDAVKEGGFVHPEHGVASHREHGGLPSSSRGSDQAALGVAHPRAGSAASPRNPTHNRTIWYSSVINVPVKQPTTMFRSAS
jgi:hypothetical protein